VPYYESVYIARPDISTAQVDTLTESLTSIIGEGGGKVTKNEYWGLKNLAYRIKKNRKGHYTLMNIDAPAAAISELERNMRINEDVLRYMTVRVDELDENPSIMMTARSSRDSRDRDRGRGRDRDRDRGAPPRAEAGADKPAAPSADKPAEASADKPAAPSADKPAEARADKPAAAAPATGDDT
jgi:small subunit ribosomal protein S6